MLGSPAAALLFVPTTKLPVVATAGEGSAPGSKTYRSHPSQPLRSYSKHSVTPWPKSVRIVSGGPKFALWNEPFMYLPCRLLCVMSRSRQSVTKAGPSPENNLAMVAQYFTTLWIRGSSCWFSAALSISPMFSYLLGQAFSDDFSHSLVPDTSTPSIRWWPLRLWCTLLMTTLCLTLWCQVSTSVQHHDIFLQKGDSGLQLILFTIYFPIRPKQHFCRPFI